MRIVLLYGGLLALLFVGLSVRTLRLRRTLRIGIGDAGNETMLRAIRVHSNFAEYVPFTLLLIYFVELTRVSPLVVHWLGTCLLVGRLLHAFGVSRVKENYSFRVFGMALTFTTIIAAAIRLLFVYATSHGA